MKFYLVFSFLLLSLALISTPMALAQFYAASENEADLVLISDKSGGPYQCNGYGRGGNRGQYKTVTGQTANSREQAVLNAKAECYRQQLSGCSITCWP